MIGSARSRLLLQGALAVAMGLLLLAPATAAAPADEPRIVAIGDIHGSLDGFLTILQATGLTDGEGTWTGGRATLVQVGDFTDRGSQVRQVMDTLMRLQGEAAAAGGEVIVLLGNHEVMNLMGNLRDVTPEIFATFATERDEELRELAWEQWVALGRQQARWLWAVYQPPGAQGRRDFFAERPPGYFEYIEALGPEGHYGRWLRSLPAVARVGDTVFVHGGLSLEVAERGVAEVNQAVARELQDFDRLKADLVERGITVPYATLEVLGDCLALVAHAAERNPRRVRDEAAFVEEAIEQYVGMNDWLSFRPDGPLWLRDYGRWEEDEGKEQIEPILEALGVERIVVGHTPPRPPSDIQMRFDGRVFMIDTGMLAGHYPGGRPSALELVGDRITAIYEDERVALAGPAESAGTSAPGDATRRASNTEEADAKVPEIRQDEPPRPVAAAPRTAPEPEPAPEPELELVPDSEDEPETRAPAPWIGPDGEPVPIGSEKELLDLLRHGEVLSIAEVGVGVTSPKKLLIERDGVHVHAIFRYEHAERQRHRLADGSFHMYFKDSHSGEPAAYELDRLLGLGNVPPVVPRRLRRLGDGSIQLWIEDAMTEDVRRDRGIEPPDRLHFIRQLYNMNVFDNLVHNVDRHLGNILIGPGWKIWYIDCTRCFARERRLWSPERVIQIERGLWERLQALDHDLVGERLGPYLSSFELRALFERHGMLVELIRERIEEKGEEAVLFTFGEPLRPVFDRLEMPEFPPATEPLAVESVGDSAAGGTMPEPSLESAPH
jgi:hypothetical protein